MKFNRASIAGIISLSLLISGCGGGKSNVTPAVLSFTSPTSNPMIDAGQSVNLTVNAAVTWSLQTPFGKPAGALTNPTSTAVTFTAPDASQVSSKLQTTVVATLVSDPTQTAAMAVIINPPLSVSGSLSQYNKNCNYDPVHQMGNPDGSVGKAFGANTNGPQAVGGTAPFTWSVSSGAVPPGLSVGWTNSTAYLFGTPITPGCSQVALQVTDAAGATASSSTNYVIIAPTPLNVLVPHYPDAYLGVPYQPVALTVSGGVLPYSWNSSGPNGISGLLGMTLTPGATNAVISGIPNAAPSNIPGNGPYTPSVTVYDSQQPYPAVGGTTLNIFEWPALPSGPCAPADGSNGGGVNTVNGTLVGSYAFLVQGFDANGPVVISGSFAADGAGNISGGVLDVMRTSGSQTGIPVASGSYSIIEQGGRGAEFSQSGCLALTTAAGTTTFALSMGGCSTGSDLKTGSCLPDSQKNPGVLTTGRLIEFDDATGSGTRGSGIVRLQDRSAFAAGLSGFFAFGLRGWDSAQKRYAEAGSFTASSASLSSVAADINDGGQLQSSLAGGSGTASAVDLTTGRGTATLAIGTPALNNLAVYVVSAQELILAGTGTPSPANPVIAGEAIAAKGPFSTSSLQNSHMYHMSGLASSGPDPAIGLLQFDGVSAFTGTQYENQGGTLSTTPLSGNYVVDGNGRISFLANSVGQNLGNHPLVGYVIPASASLARQNCVKLASCVTGFLLSTDLSAQAGLLEFQTPTIAPPPPFSNLYVAGYYFYGTDEMMDAGSTVMLGAASTNPTGAQYVAIQSESYPNSSYCQQPGCAVLVPNETLATGGTYSVNSNGTGTVGAQTVAITNGNLTFYLDESPLNLHPAVTVLEQ